MLPRFRMASRLVAGAAFAFAAVVLGAAGCGDDDAAYDISCSVDEDCVVVGVSPPCQGCPSCGRTTINRKDEARYAEDLAEQECDEYASGSCGVTCDLPNAVCSEGTCALR